MIVNGLRAAGISDAIKNAKDITEKVENPFRETLVFFSFLILVFLRLKQKKGKFSFRKRRCCVFSAVLSYPFL